MNLASTPLIKQVINTWPNRAKKWKLFTGEMSTYMATQEREAEVALRRDIYNLSSACSLESFSHPSTSLVRTIFFQVHDSSILRACDWLIDTFYDSSPRSQAFNSNHMAKIENRHFTEVGWGRVITLAQKRYPLVAECQVNLDT